MITPEFAKTLARYNQWQNRSLVEAADGLSDKKRWQNNGAFFNSIAETLNHILWDDRIWLARLRGDEATASQIGERHPYTDTPRAWSVYTQERSDLDSEIVTWADSVTEYDLLKPARWTRDSQLVETDSGFNFVHMVNHQTHHRGQVHAMLTRAGAEPRATDLLVLRLSGQDGVVASRT